MNRGTKPSRRVPRIALDRHLGNALPAAPPASMDAGQLGAERVAEAFRIAEVNWQASQEVQRRGPGEGRRR